MKNFTRNLAKIAKGIGLAKAQAIAKTLAIAISIILATTLSTAFLSVPSVYADDPDPAPATGTGSNTGSMTLENFKNLTFPVQDYLKLPGNKQPQTYFNTDDTTTNQTKFPLIKFILDAIDTLAKIAGTIAVTLMIVTGFMMIFSQGSQNILEKAKQMFTYELIGLIVIVLSYVMVTLVQGLLTTG